MTVDIRMPPNDTITTFEWSGNGDDGGFDKFPGWGLPSFAVSIDEMRCKGSTSSRPTVVVSAYSSALTESSLTRFGSVSDELGVLEGRKEG